MQLNEKPHTHTRDRRKKSQEKRQTHKYFRFGVIASVQRDAHLRHFEKCELEFEAHRKQTKTYYIVNEIIIT